jgi:protein-S-isoprenylcysteine O-methyltransferase Ste14
MGKIVKNNKDTARLPIAPPMIMAISLGVALIFGWKLPIPIPFPAWMKFCGWAILLGGLGSGLSALRALMSAKTSPDPGTPTAALVQKGPYRFSRNPIYLGYVLVVIGLPLLFGYYWGAILAPVAIDSFNRFIISREEIYLAEKFGQEYQEYKARVRRWI